MDNSIQTNFNEKIVVKDCINKPSLTPLEIVKILLKERALKQVDLAAKIGMSRQGLHNYLRGVWVVPTQIKIKVAEALEVDSSVIWDLGGINDRRNS